MLATKLYGTMADRPNEWRLSALNIRRAVDSSPRRLQTDYIDPYQFHHVDRMTPVGGNLAGRRRRGPAGQDSVFGQQQLRRLADRPGQEAAARRHSTGLVSEQPIHKLLTRSVELEVIPAAEQYGLGLVPWSPLQGGLPGGVLKNGRGGVRRAESRSRDTLGKHREQLHQYEDFADELAREPGDIALARLLHQPAVTAPVVGPRTRDQLHSDLRAADLALEPSALQRLDDIFPGCRTAPEDYAW